MRGSTCKAKRSANAAIGGLCSFGFGGTNAHTLVEDTEQCELSGIDYGTAVQYDRSTFGCNRNEWEKDSDQCTDIASSAAVIVDDEPARLHRVGWELIAENCLDRDCVQQDAVGGQWTVLDGAICDVDAMIAGATHSELVHRVQQYEAAVLYEELLSVTRAVMARVVLVKMMCGLWQ